VILSLFEWAVENHYSNQLTGEMEFGAAVAGEQENPEAVYNNLTDDRMLQAESLEEAASVLVACVGRVLGPP
jgi:hypothetical protein